MPMLIALLCLGLTLFALAAFVLLRRAGAEPAPDSVTPEGERLWRASTEQRLAQDIAELRRTMREADHTPVEEAFWAGTDFAETQPATAHSLDTPAVPGASAWAAPQGREDLRVILNF